MALFPDYETWRAERPTAPDDESVMDRLTQYYAELREHANREYEDTKLEIVNQYGTWAVTKYGVEALQTAYSISKDRLRQNRWLLHMSEKTWVNMHDFLRAFYDGRHYHYPEKFPTAEEFFGQGEVDHAE
jgi:hypothetical protein